METKRRIPYGVINWARLVGECLFVDNTSYIRKLEEVDTPVFLRPKRFGKSIVCSMLAHYYDVNLKDRFDELFGSTDIGRNPTPLRNSFLVLPFDFSTIQVGTLAEIERNFWSNVQGAVGSFAVKYRNLADWSKVKSATGPANCIDKVREVIRENNLPPLYVIIDEYDNFTNTILAESGLNAYNDLCHGDGFFKDFFARLKAATTGTEAPVTRLFITGVSPVTMDDVTSGFNIGTNISLMPQYADFTGFRHDDLRAISDYYAEQCGFDADMLYETALTWYDNYRFGSADAPALANTTIVLSFFSYVWRTRRFPNKLIDENLRTDYAKIRHLVTMDRRLNGNFHVLENLLSGGSLTEQLVESFQARELTKKENFTSLLYWLGITTITGGSFGKAVFGLPNETLKELAAKMIPDAYSDIYKIDGRIFDVNKELVAFAEKGEWRGFVDILSSIVKENFAVRDTVEGEKVVQSTLVALLTAAGGPYLVRHEREAGGGFYDIALKPQLDRWPEIAHSALIEMKYVKKGDPKPTPEQLAAIKSDAIAQLDKYSGDSTLHSTLYTLHSSVSLHRLVLVFHGGECLLSEEV